MKQTVVTNNELERALGRIEGKLDAMGYTVLEHVKDDKVSFTTIELRLSIIERKLYVFLGGFIVLWGVVSLGKDVIGKFFA